MRVKGMVFLLLLLGVGSSVAGAYETRQWHYFDMEDQPLPQCEPVYDELKAYFHEMVPEKIKVEYTDLNRGRFDPVNQRVLIGKNRDKTNFIRGVAHESSHLAMVLLTKKASIKEEFRFCDEGFANIIQNIINHTEADYKTKALTIAAIQHSKNNVSFAKVQKWSEYYGNPKMKTTSYAYPVGSSFDYYVIDTFGMDKLFEFFKDIGQTRDLDTSLKNVLKHDSRWIETGWLDYLKRVKISEAQPQIIKMDPVQGAAKVSPAISEIYVEFDTPMSRDIIIIRTNSNDAICYTNAYWKTDRILAIKVNLAPDFQYKISLGADGSARLMSRVGIELPVTLWTFTTVRNRGRIK